MTKRVTRSATARARRQLQITDDPADSNEQPPSPANPLLSAATTTYDSDTIAELLESSEEEDDEKIEEMIDDISTNEMFGSSILSNGDGDN